jgi:Family of unknown function (DUF5924)
MEQGGDALRSRRGALWPQFVTRFDALHSRYARTFWTIHSLWALLTGAAVLVLAHNRYGYVPWVVGFLALTWASTLFFSRLATVLSSRAWRFARGFVSYLTRIMYQETLFFLIPFYFYSTTFPSWNCLYVVLLAALAVLSCFDLIFDRLLRQKPLFAMGFFSIVSFSALQFLFPLLLGIPVHVASYAAAVLAVLASVPLAYPWRVIFAPRRLALLLVVLLAALGVVRLFRPAVPPVPLRLMKIRFSTSFARTARVTPREFIDTIPASALTTGRLYAIATIFAPTALHTSVLLRFYADGRIVRTSRIVELVVQPRGFRIYDALPLRSDSALPRTVRVEAWTGEGQLIGRATTRIVVSRRKG